MGILLSVSTVLFVVLCVILVIIILLQSDKSAGMGILGGSSQSAFGSSTADVITKITTVMVALFMLGSLGLAILESNKSTSLEKKIFSTDDILPEVLQKEKASDKEGEKAEAEKTGSKEK